MAFVGLTELHNASICLFHRRFGGAPRDDEFALYRVGRGHDRQARPPDANADAISTGVGTRALDRLYTGGGASGIALQYDDTPLEGFVDALDEVVYAAALARFGADVSEALAEL